MPYAAIDYGAKALPNRTDFVALWRIDAVYNALTALEERVSN